MKDSSAINDLVSRHILSPSILLLQQKITSYFNQEFPGEGVTFPNAGCDITWPLRGTTNVVLFGDAFSRPLRIDYWPRSGRYRFLFLGSAMRNAFAELCSLSPDELGIVPRYQIFPAGKPRQSQGDTSFVLSSRLVSGKNTEAVLEFFRSQERKVSHSHFYICGPGDIHSRLSQYSNLPENLTVLGDLGSQWMEYPFKGNPVCVNFSTYFSEDFGVSIAEAQAAGLGILATDWGGHRDLQGENVSLLSRESLEKCDWENTYCPVFRREDPLNLSGLRIFSWEDLHELRQKLLSEHEERNLDYANTTLVSPEIRRIILKHFSGLSG